MNRALDHKHLPFPPCRIVVFPNMALKSSAVFLAAGARNSSAALPGVRVRTYPTSPTRDDRLEDAERAAQDRLAKARRIEAKSRRDRKILLAQAMEKNAGKVIDVLQGGFFSFCCCGRWCAVIKWLSFSCSLGFA